ncbi:MAG TPA: sigma-70 family RNA polymerase sigma factor, partial [Acidimicrobiales bacterium]
MPDLAPVTERSPHDGLAELVSLRDTAARVVHARYAGAEREDMVQEAWTRVAVALRDRAIDDPHAYTAGIAANLVRGWDRRDRRRQRRAPLLWVRPTVDPPDGDVVRDEEGTALATALERLPAPARDVLVAHVVHGLDTATLAREAGTSAGAVAACLARARAMLRVQYLIAFRHLAPPPDHCLRVCYAVSAGDARREVRLDAAGHVRRCDTCRSIVETVRERRRPAMGAALALRFSGWGARLTQPDWQQAGPRAG